MDSRIVALSEIINKSQEEIKKIQDECTHKYRTVGNYGYGAHFESGLICDDCGTYLGWAKTYNEWIETLFFEGMEYKERVRMRKIRDNKTINIYGDSLIIEKEFLELIEKYL